MNAILYYGVVLLALPAMKSRLLLAAYLVLSVVLYLNDGYTLDLFLPGPGTPRPSPVALQRALAFAALAGGAAFLFAIVSSLLDRNLNGHPAGAAVGLSRNPNTSRKTPGSASDS